MKIIASWLSVLAFVFVLAPTAFGTRDEGRMPPLDGAVAWLNTAPLNSKSLRGKVVVINFWTYSCINSLRELPYLKAWAAKYKEAGLVVIGVHTPEFGFEKDPANVKTAVAGLGIEFPVPLDSDYSIWSAFRNEYWPANYFIDGRGRVRYHHFGEGDYEQSERVIQELLRENGVAAASDQPVRPSATGAEAPPSEDVLSPETYTGYQRVEHFASGGRFAPDSIRNYSLPSGPSLNQWGLGGRWLIGPEWSALQAAPGRLKFRFYARDLHMVLGPPKSGHPIRFKATLNGILPGEDHGVDTGPDGVGEIRQPRLYQLIRRKGRVEDGVFEIEFLDPGAQVFSITFG